MGMSLIEIYREKVKKEWKIAFFAVIIIGFLIHIYKFTNTLPNHDSVYNYYSDQNIIGLGRWFLSIACGFSSYFDLPWVNGLFSVIFIAIAAIFITDIFEMKNPFQITLSSALLVSFPAITETLFFEFTADGYMLAMLLAALAVWLTRIDKPGITRTIVSAVCICLACATYQAYVSFGLVLAFCYVIYKILIGGGETKDYLQYAARQIIIYAAGLIAYYAIWQIVMQFQDANASSYQGVASVSLSLTTILQAIPGTIKTLMFFFVEWNVFEHGWTLYGVLNVIFILLFIAFLIMAICKQRLFQRRGQLLLLLIALIAIPFASCIWLFTSSDVSYRPMMLQSLCILYIFLGVIAEEFLRVRWKNLAGILLAIIVFNYGIMANIAYYYMNQEYEASYAIASEILTRIHLMDLDGEKIAVLGSDGTNVSLGDHDEYADKIHIFTALLEENLLFDTVHTVLFINNTFDCDYDRASDEEIETLELSDEVAEMGVWPASDSIQMIGDTIVIKMSEVSESP